MPVCYNDSRDEVKLFLRTKWHEGAELADQWWVLEKEGKELCSAKTLQGLFTIADDLRLID